jgi:hypothetical protein
VSLKREYISTYLLQTLEKLHCSNIGCEFLECAKYMLVCIGKPIMEESGGGIGCGITTE